MRHLPRRIDDNDRLAAEDPELGAVLRGDAGEVGGEAVVIRLREPFVGMVVALGALQPDPEKELRGRLGEIGGIVGDAEIVGRAAGEDRALGGDQFGHEPVKRLVRAEALLEPIVEGPHPALAEHGRVVADQIGPLQAPPGGVAVDMPVAGRIASQAEELVDEPLPLVGRGRGEESAGLVGRRQGADGVEVGAPQKGGVVAQPRGGQTDLGKLFPDHRIERMGAFPAGEIGARGEGDNKRRDRRLATEPGHHRPLAPAERRRHPGRRHLHDPLVHRVKPAPAGDVAAPAVGVSRHHADLLRRPRARHALHRLDLQPRDRRGGARRARAAGADPAGQERVVGGIVGEPRAAAMRN